MTTIPPLSFLEAIAREEGFFVPGTRANRNRNPGNIDFGPFAVRHGALRSDGRFAIFPTAAAGWNCMATLFQADYKDLTVAQSVAKWAPSGENDTRRYLSNVCKWSGLAADARIETHLSFPPPLSTT